MKAHLLLLLLLIFSGNLLAQPAEGGKEIGNGGDVVVCKNDDGSIRSVELLDFYEAKVYNNTFYELGSNDSSIETKITIALERLERFAPGLAKTFQKQANSFIVETAFIPNAQLIDISDSHHLAIPSGCDINQIAIQIKPVVTWGKRYTINKDLWDRLDNNNKTGLILHELIYRHAIEHGHQNSIATRLFNGLLLSKDIENYNYEKLQELIILMSIHTEVRFYGLDFTSFHGAKFDFFDNQNMRSINGGFLMEMTLQNQKITVISEIEYYENGNLKYTQIILPPLQPLTLQLNDTSITLGNLDHSQSCKLSFWENGILQNSDCNFAKDIVLPLGNNNEILIPIRSNQISLNPNGTLNNIILSTEIDIFLQGNNILIRGYLSFYASGNPKSICLTENDIALKNIEGKVILYDWNDCLELDENGLVIKKL